MADLTYQELLGIVSAGMSLAGTTVYIRSILMGYTKPHLYTWVVFSLLTIIAFTAQLMDNAGPGSWMMGATAFSCTLTTVLCLKYGEKSRTRADKISLIAALTAIVPWLLTNDPLLSVIMISFIDGIGLIPTIRKSLVRPYDENLSAYWIANAKNMMGLFALTNFTVTTSLFMISTCFVNTTLIGVCLYKRKSIPKPDRSIQAKPEAA